MTHCRQMVHNKKTIQTLKSVVKAALLVPDPFQGFHNMYLTCFCR